MEDSRFSEIAARIAALPEPRYRAVLAFLQAVLRECEQEVASALARFDDQELRDRVPGLPDWVTDEDVSAELEQRRATRRRLGAWT